MISLWRQDVLPSARSPPLRNVSFSPGGRGTRRVDLDVSLGFPGDFGKEMARNETPIFLRAPTGAAEKVRTERTWGGAEVPRPAGNEGRNGIIGPGLGIVFEFRPDFFQAGRVAP